MAAETKGGASERERHGKWLLSSPSRSFSRPAARSCLPPQQGRQPGTCGQRRAHRSGPPGLRQAPPCHLRPQSPTGGLPLGSKLQLQPWSGHQHHEKHSGYSGPLPQVRHFPRLRVPRQIPHGLCLQLRDRSDLWPRSRWETWSRQRDNAAGAGTSSPPCALSCPCLGGRPHRVPVRGWRRAHVWPEHVPPAWTHSTTATSTRSCSLHCQGN